MKNTPAAGTLLRAEVSAPQFSIITKALGDAGTGDDGRRRFRATASSTITDRAGHAITVKALEQMAARFRDGITIFTDHKNEVEHAYGTTDTAQIIQRGQDKMGAPIWDLDIAGVVNDPNPNAKQLHDSIEGGYVRLGCSIDAFVLDHDRDRKSGTMVIDGLDVFAASIVGVPMNQRSWTQKALRAVKSFYGEPDEEDSVVTKELDPEAVTESEAAETNILMATAPTETVTDDATEVVIKAQVCVACGGETAAEGCDNSFHTAAPEAAVADEATEAVEDAAITGIASKGLETPGDGVILAATTEGGQEADPSATPETAPEVEDVLADPAPVQKALSFETTDVVELVGHVSRLVKALEIKGAEITALTTERDALASENEDAKKVIEKMMTLPLRPKTVGYVEDLNDRYPDYLAPEVKKMLIRKSQEKTA